MNKINYILISILLLCVGSVSAIYVGVNATGWSELYDDGDLIGAAFTMYDTAFLGWTVAILFFIYQFMLLLKAQNLMINFVTGVMFASLYLTGILVTSISTQVIYTILVIELGGILYYLFWK